MRRTTEQNFSCTALSTIIRGERLLKNVPVHNFSFYYTLLPVQVFSSPEKPGCESYVTRVQKSAQNIFLRFEWQQNRSERAQRALRTIQLNDSTSE